jgi:hypothetical protein
MKSFSLNDLKKELVLLPAKDLADLCVSLAKYKKDNKEFLSYLLVDSYDKPGFIKEIKDEMDLYFSDLNAVSNLHNAKKTLRKILRFVTKYCKYINDKAVTVELHLYFCNKILSSGLPYKRSQLIVNMYERQLKRIAVLIEGLHEDLQGDFNSELRRLQMEI